MLEVYCFMVNDVLSVGWGYNAIWISWLYIMGGALRMIRDLNYFSVLNYHRKHGRYILLYFLTVIINWSLFYYGYENAYINSRVQRYNNIFIVLGAISLFWGLSDIETDKSTINKFVTFFSSCCFSVYLIQVNPLFWNQVVSKRYLYLLNSSANQYLIHFVTHVILSFIILCGIDKVRQCLFELLKVNKLVDIIGDTLNKYVR